MEFLQSKMYEGVNLGAYQMTGVTGTLRYTLKALYTASYTSSLRPHTLYQMTGVTGTLRYTLKALYTASYTSS